MEPIYEAHNSRIARPRRRGDRIARIGSNDGLHKRKHGEVRIDEFEHAGRP